MYFYSCIAFIQVEMHLLEGPDYGRTIVEEECERKEEVHLTRQDLNPQPLDHSNF